VAVHSVRPAANSGEVIKQALRGAHYFLEDNWKRVWVMVLWIAICTGLFTWKFLQYRRRAVFDVMGYCVCVAKGGAEMLKFNMALILMDPKPQSLRAVRRQHQLAQGDRGGHRH
jgi:respiratory burst oxidase